MHSVTMTMRRGATMQGVVPMPGPLQVSRHHRAAEVVAHDQLVGHAMAAVDRPR